MEAMDAALLSDANGVGLDASGGDVPVQVVDDHPVVAVFLLQTLRTYPEINDRHV